MNYNQPRRLLFLDCETLPEDRRKSRTIERHRLRLGIMSKWLADDAKRESGSDRHLSSRQLSYRRSRIDSFHSTDSFLELLGKSTSSRYPTWLFAHKASFDCQVAGLFNALKERSWRIDTRASETPDDPEADFWAETMRSFFVVGDPPTAMALRSPKGHKLYVVDTMNYWRCSLSQLGRQVGLDKLPMPDFTDDAKTWETYCIRDVEIIEKAIVNLITWLDENQIGRMRYTASGLAAEAFKVGFPESRVFSHQDVDTRQLEREGYFGGEVRAFRVGKVQGDLYQVDVNSLYPALMFSRHLPYALKRTCRKPTWRKGPPPGDPQTLMAEVWIRDYGDSYPVRIKGSTNYARGSFATILCGDELAGAIKRGDVLGHKRWAEYKLSDLFSGFVHKFWNLRREAKLEGDLPTDLFCKSLLNSLYGRFGMMSQNMVQRTDFVAPIDFGDWATVSTSTGKIRKFKVMDHRPFEILGKKEIRGKFPAVSAFITAAGREYMRGLRRLVGRRCLVYQGVDSLVVTRAGMMKLDRAGLVDPMALGKLKIEGRATDAEIVGFGNYRFGSKLVTVGRKSSAVMLDDRHYTQTAIQSAPELIFAPPGATVSQTTRRLTMPAPTVEGEIRPNGDVWPRRFTSPLPRAFYLTE
jgi:hypothetical protein